MSDKKEDNVVDSQEGVPRLMTFADLERQMEQGGLFTHTNLSVHAERINRMESFLYGLADTLLDEGVITEDFLRSHVERAAVELREKKETLSGGVAMRMDPDQAPEPPAIDCTSRLAVCNAVCCRLSFPLSASEIESGRIRWELGKPYYIRKDTEGHCVHVDKTTGRCAVYTDRPRVCRTYSCKGDKRIWKDFDNMILNQEWIDETLKPENPVLMAIRMDRVG